MGLVGFMGGGRGFVFGYLLICCLLGVDRSVWMREEVLIGGSEMVVWKERVIRGERRGVERS